MKFSIIVPVYNVKDYLETCMNSLLRQDYLDYEILLIDDGATDGSGELCDRYQNDTRVRVFHKPNGGLSDARNYGIERATGDYLVFVDSDDWIEPSSLSEFSRVLYNNPVADILVTRLIESFDDGKNDRYKDQDFEKYLEGERFTKERAFEWNCWKSQNSFPAPKYIVGRNFVTTHGLKFLKGRLHEDIDWTCNLWYLAEEYAGCSYPWYHHRMNREGAITASINTKHYIDMMEIASIHYKAKDKDSFHKDSFARIMGTLYAWLRYTKDLDNEDLQIIGASMQANNEIFSVAPELKHKLFVVIYKLFGSTNALRMLRAYR